MTDTLQGVLPRRYRLRLIGIVLLTGSLLFFLGGPDYDAPRSWKELWNLGHIIYFALFTYLLHQWRLITQLSQPRQWGLILAITLVTGILVELLQYGTQRLPDLWDVSRDLSGSLLVLSFNTTYATSTLQHWGRVLKASALILLLALSMPLVTSIVDENMARQKFPLLADFETPFETQRWIGDAHRELTQLPISAHNNLLAVTLGTQQYSGIALKYFPHDWRQYRTLKIRLFQPQVEPLPITCRIHDRQHTRGAQDYDDRYNQGFLLHQGWNEIEIKLDAVAVAPASRQMDMSQIHGLGLFSVALPQARKIYLERIYLSN